MIMIITTKIMIIITKIIIMMLIITIIIVIIIMVIQANLDITDSMGPGKLVRHMQNTSYTYDTYLICIGLGPSI